MYDKDGSGTIEMSEMIEILETVYLMEGVTVGNMARTRAKAIFQELDVNGDGSLTCDEFISGCMKDEEMMQMLKNNDEDEEEEEDTETSSSKKPTASKKGAAGRKWTRSYATTDDEVNSLNFTFIGISFTALNNILKLNFTHLKSNLL